MKAARKLLRLHSARTARLRLVHMVPLHLPRAVLRPMLNMANQDGEAFARRSAHALFRLMFDTINYRRLPVQVRNRFWGARGFIVFAGVLCLVLFTSCKRESRQFNPPPSTFQVPQTAQSQLRPGGLPPPPAINNPVEESAYAVSEGKRLYSQYNCSGCHFNGGGGIGPALMDEKWIYGSAPANIYSTILEGRPNGMPAFRDKIPDNQVWQLVGYVRSLSGQLPKDVSPTRSDDMNARKSESTSEKKKPVNSSQSKSTEQP